MGVLGGNDRARAEYLAAQAPIIADLAAVGVTVALVQDLTLDPNHDPRAIPVLVDWLPRIEYQSLKHSVVRALAQPWAFREAAPALINEATTRGLAYPQLDPVEQMVMDGIASAFMLRKDQRFYRDILALASDPELGDGRANWIRALAKYPEHVDEFLPLLAETLGVEDESSPAIANRIAAAEAIGKLGDRRGLAVLDSVTGGSSTALASALRQARAQLARATDDASPN